MPDNAPAMKAGFWPVVMRVRDWENVAPANAWETGSIVRDALCALVLSQALDTFRDRSVGKGIGEEA